MREAPRVGTATHRRSGPVRVPTSGGRTCASHPRRSSSRRRHWSWRRSARRSPRPGYTITSSKQIKPGSISLELAEQERTQGAARRARPGRPAGRDGRRRRGRLRRGRRRRTARTPRSCSRRSRPTARINASSAGVTAPATPEPGLYYVNFGQDITECAATATQGSIPDYASAGHSTTGIPGPAFVVMSSAGADFAPGFPSVSSVTVQTRRTNGTLASTSFAIAVFC